MRTRMVSSRIADSSGFGTGMGETECIEYECPCRKGRIIEEHDNISGFRNHSVYLLCPECEKHFYIDTSSGVRNWTLVRKRRIKMKSQPYLSRIHIENFRNFHSVDVALGEKQVLIGENSVGKSNLLYALQLILDPTLSERDRMLEESDFWDGLNTPMENGIPIIIEIFLSNYEDNKGIMAQLSDASVIVDGEEFLKITYKFYRADEKTNTYRYVIFKGNDESRTFTYEDRKMLNVRVIKAIRDVENEMRNTKTSPLTQIIKSKYSISKTTLADISKSLDEKGADTLRIGQVTDLERKLGSLLNEMVAFSQQDFQVSLRTMNLDATKLLYALRPLINCREAANTSLGINNILYIALILLLIEDDTVKTYLSAEERETADKYDNAHILSACYDQLENGDYRLNLNALSDADLYKRVYDLLADVLPTSNGVTILAVEEPEAHLHPIYQRLLYKHIVSGSKNSVMITTHSTHISSVAPIKSIVHLVAVDGETRVSSTASLKLSESDFDDLSRYVDVKRGEIYTAKGIIFVEGIAEEYLIPCFAISMGIDLDRLGVVVCNINSTNFLPYCQFAKELNIPYVIVTDGDYYVYESDRKQFKILVDNSQHAGFGYDGFDRCFRDFSSLIPADYADMSIMQKYAVFEEIGIFIGVNTLEIDIFRASNEDDLAIISTVFSQLTAGGETQKANFEKELKSGDFDKCLSKIESSYSGIGKGRFAQRLANVVTMSMIPPYIKKAVVAIEEKVRIR